MSFGDGNLHAQVAQLKTENARLKQQVDKLPEIVRCMDCEHYTHSSWHRCDLYSIAHEVEPDGFCAYGERKES